MLSHLRVLDCTDLRGALAGRILADLGAAVTRIVAPRHADDSVAARYRRLGTRALPLDLHDAGDAARFRALCDEADVLLENFGANRRQVLDLAPEAVRARHPRLVHVALTDFGLDGPRAQWRAEPLVAFAASGALFASGFADRAPCWLPGFAAHDCGAVAGVAGALAALLDRARHGGGQTVEVSAQEAAIAGFYPWAIPLADYARHYPMLPTAPPRRADGSYLVLPVADGHVRILPAGQRHWRAFVAMIDRADAFAGPEWDLAIYRNINADVIRVIAAEALAGRTRAAVFADALARGVPLAPVLTPEEFVAHPHTVARTVFGAHPDLPGAPVASLRRLAASDTPEGAATAAPYPTRRGEAAPSAATEPTTDGPLAGRRVVVFGYAVVAPEAGTLLAELGAEVVRVESRANLDLLRQITIEPDTPNRAFTFNDASRGQRSVCLDLRQARGRALALDLCASADVVLENYRGGALHQHGITYDAVRARRADVVWISSQGFGASGPLAGAPAFGPLNAAFAGVHWLWSEADTPYPAGTALNHPDHIASKLVAALALAALEQRRLSGAGRYLDVAQIEIAALLVGDVYAAAALGRPPRQRGNAADDAVPHGVYPCAGDDRWLAVAVPDDAAWQRLARCCGWPDEAALATLAGRRAARAAIDARLAAWTSAREAEAAAATLQAAGVSAMAVLGPDELRDDAHLLAREAIVTVAHAEIGPERHIGTPWRMSRTPLPAAGAAPLLGADTADVLQRWLALPADEVQALLASDVCR